MSQNCADANFGKGIMVKCPSGFCASTFPNTFEYLLQIKIQRCLQKYWGVNYDMAPILVIKLQ